MQRKKVKNPPFINHAQSEATWAKGRLRCPLAGVRYAAASLGATKD